jgi:hypothetical protein
VTVAAGVVSLVSLAVVVASLTFLHVEPTGLSPVRSAVSQYGITSFRTGYRVATIGFAVAGIALAVGIDRVARGGGKNAVVVLLFVFALSRAAISWFPMDAPGTEPSQVGRTHGMLAFVAFVSAALAAFRLAGVLSKAQHWHSLATVSAVLGWAMVVCLVALALSRSFPAMKARFGMIERGFYLSAIVWFAVFSFACATNR